MANQITALLQNDSLRDELHKNAFSEFEKMSWSNAADQLMDIYRYHTEKVMA
jgi:glycosyltransferase involved in cell wall biosynthesis